MRSSRHSLDGSSSPCLRSPRLLKRKPADSPSQVAPTLRRCWCRPLLGDRAFLYAFSWNVEPSRDTKRVKREPFSGSCRLLPRCYVQEENLGCGRKVKGRPNSIDGDCSVYRRGAVGSRSSYGHRLCTLYRTVRPSHVHHLL